MCPGDPIGAMVVRPLKKAVFVARYDARKHKTAS
jgi:hypothetical protein